MTAETHATREGKLFAVAELQNGYFTARQAFECGYRHSNFPYYIKQNKWKKVVRGVYRLVNYPVSENEQYTIWSLWVGEKKGIPEGAYSGITALSFYELTDVIPSKLHVTIPRNFIIRKKQTSDLLVFHKEDISAKDLQYFEGYAMTVPRKALLDVAREHCMDHDHFIEAVRESYKRGYISKSFLLENPEFRGVVEYLFNI